MFKYAVVHNGRLRACFAAPETPYGLRSDQALRAHITPSSHSFLTGRQPEVLLTPVSEEAALWAAFSAQRPQIPAQIRPFANAGRSAA